MGYLFQKQSLADIDSQTLQAIFVALGYPVECDGKIPLLEIPLNLNHKYKEIKWIQT